MAKICELQADVKRYLANRTDSYDLAPFWIRNAIRELTYSYDFPELQDIGPTVQLTANQARYDTSFFVNANIPFTRICAWDFLTDYPNNTVSKNIKFRELPVVLPMSKIAALPSTWTRHGDAIIFGNMPDQPYTVTCYYQRRHYFEGSHSDPKDIAQTEIMMPDVWLEIVAIAAAERGALELRMPDYVSLYHSTLFGDPKNPDKPGLIAGVVAQHQIDKSNNEGQITPQIVRYT